MSVGLRGTTLEQDVFFQDKTKKMLSTTKWSNLYEKKVDLDKVSLDFLKPWISKRITELLGFEDDIVIDYCWTQLTPDPTMSEEDGKREVDPKVLQINLTGFMAKKAGVFVKELWELMLSAQDNPAGIPQQLIDEKKNEMQRKRIEAERIQQELVKRQAALVQEEQLRNQNAMVSSAWDKSKADILLKSEPVPVLPASTGALFAAEAAARVGALSAVKQAHALPLQVTGSSGAGANIVPSRDRSVSQTSKSSSDSAKEPVLPPRRSRLDERRKSSRSPSPRRHDRRSRRHRSPSPNGGRRFRERREEYHGRRRGDTYASSYADSHRSDARGRNQRFYDRSRNEMRSPERRRSSDSIREGNGSERFSEGGRHRGHGPEMSRHGNERLGRGATGTRHRSSSASLSPRGERAPPKPRTMTSALWVPETSNRRRQSPSPIPARRISRSRSRSKSNSRRPTRARDAEPPTKRRAVPKEDNKRGKLRGWSRSRSPSP
eukprot:GHVT01021032.1.p1 GENE.GHVT01021032.1~~GHVT01021032.1.p1  ORF type:complete len:491 (-),score=45.91 GHVT01021032.1:1779-3251(-)